jgi:hypothetical protein
VARQLSTTRTFYTDERGRCPRTYTKDSEHHDANTNQRHNPMRAALRPPKYEADLVPRVNQRTNTRIKKGEVSNTYHPMGETRPPSMLRNRRASGPSLATATEKQEEERNREQSLKAMCYGERLLQRRRYRDSWIGMRKDPKIAPILCDEPESPTPVRVKLCRSSSTDQSYTRDGEHSDARLATVEVVYVLCDERHTQE